MQETVLTRIVRDKQVWVAERRQKQPLESFRHKVIPSERNFYQALTSDNSVFILECKKASPSKGVIRQNFDPRAIAESYRNFASVISVLTDEKYFQGNFDYLTLVSNQVHQPVLCKDFIIDEYQIYLARFYHADAVLLMLSVLDDEQYIALSAVAHSLNMGVLTEASNESELQRAIALQARVVGINNRDLRDLSIDLNRTRTMAPQLPESTIVISESGIHNYQQVRELSQYADGFLIGSALMSEENLDLAIRRVLFGANKVCGLTRSEDAAAAYHAGAVYGGLIFVGKSPRYIDLVQAQKVVAAAPLNWVGVFSNAKADTICLAVERLNLSAVQLHGNEDNDYIDDLRSRLPATCLIWKAQTVDGQLPELNHPQVDCYVLDNGAGGTGQTFDWQVLQGQTLDKAMVAGGLNPGNTAAAANLGCQGLDFNSGVESEPGHKDITKINAVFSILRNY
ncbi:bifunctional indole-3-glycerol-phosphate synthase TrpC/phosphoribosylanthranilate isomerase TrpF [Budviciaceae bacterium BWR-B9]|uniref:Multifunctional fusion protein n=1 Tax=Limnobaculum allomyrinae TaxID=2791986 RepID=A0ABS1IL13_9GAMM|nr:MULTISPECIES: bifunctional indole-3-glycerol-phosphate synthase TrpC/phosphoribosylanthranilate isomerase TrpF [Limnobaculum]MBK5142439.1 bifunctional indole-3-glycerol-phosphate synthase TrpC/phosphoribosylanthranilate isomerase TrpF [Limnobaculum allomyrinae]MBV7690676.1 bifunctional indole-3-glycerol-phosphate synthase TrpC/phosphoribosylanthranilate isomerase TrpF [Limnobaculum sp. M2-1]